MRQDPPKLLSTSPKPEAWHPPSAMAVVVRDPAGCPNLGRPAVRRAATPAAGRALWAPKLLECQDHPLSVPRQPTDRRCHPLVHPCCRQALADGAQASPRLSRTGRLCGLAQPDEHAPLDGAPPPPPPAGTPSPLLPSGCSATQLHGEPRSDHASQRASRGQSGQTEAVGLVVDPLPRSGVLRGPSMVPPSHGEGWGSSTGCPRRAAGNCCATAAKFGELRLGAPPRCKAGCGPLRLDGWAPA